MRTILKQLKNYCQNNFGTFLEDALEHSVSSPGSLFAFLQFLLSFAELGQVQSSDLLGILDLLLVGLDLALQLAGKVSHPVLVLLVLIVLEQNLLDTTLRFLEGLLVLGSLRLEVAQFDLNKFKIVTNYKSCKKIQKMSTPPTL